MGQYGWNSEMSDIFKQKSPLSNFKLGLSNGFESNIRSQKKQTDGWADTAYT
jgi:hypothetical protein